MHRNRLGRFRNSSTRRDRLTRTRSRIASEPSATRFTRRLRCEPLEDRTLLSALGIDQAVALAAEPVSSRGIWLSADEIMQLPTSGIEWETVLSAAKGSIGTPDISNQSGNDDVKTLAKALVGVRLGNQQYMAEARNAVMAAMDTEDGGRTLALGRNLVSYVIAADLVGLDPQQDA
ncbi:MAG TPA: hypothetical protein VMY42_27115, partial [Thermoguttaceae bacterium]|nr:hypothetical protein [Thermoguttaceae bacterium]